MKPPSKAWRHSRRGCMECQQGSTGPCRAHPASLRKIGPPAYAGGPASGSVVVSLDPSDRAAGVVSDGEPHRHGRRRPDLSALALGLELEVVAAPGLDLHFQPRASRAAFELERAVPVAPERALGDRRREGPDLESHILGERINPDASRAQGECSLHLEFVLVTLVFDLNPGVEGGERRGSDGTELRHEGVEEAATKRRLEGA